MGKSIKKILCSKQFYEWAFILVVLLSFLVWLGGIFSGGMESKQFGIFFGGIGGLYDFMADTLNVVGYSSQRDVYHNMMYTDLAEKAYPPLTYMMMYFFSRLVDMNTYYEKDFFLGMYTEKRFLIMYMIYACIGVVMLYEVIRTSKKGSNPVKIFTAASVMLSAPVIYSFERANTIILTTFCVMFYVFFYDSGNKIMKELALICLAIATAFKLTPAVLGILLLYNKQWKEAVRVVIYGIIVGFLPFLFFEGGFSNFPQMLKNMKANVDYYTSADGVTLYASVLNFGAVQSDRLKNTMSILTYIVSALLLVSAVFYKKTWARIATVCMVLIILPSHSGYYCILYFVPAIIAFLNEEKHSLTELLVLASILLIMYDVQSDIGNKVLNYHLAILVITAYLVVLGVVSIVQCARKFCAAHVAEK